MNDTRIPPSYEVRKHAETTDYEARRQVQRRMRDNVAIFLMSVVGWTVAGLLWWLGGKIQ